MKCHHPGVFCAAPRNAQPISFYATAEIVIDAREHGIDVRPVDVNASRCDRTLEPTGGRFMAVRLGLRMADELRNADGAAIVLERSDRPYTSVEEVQRRAEVGAGALKRIGAADEFGSLELSHRSGLWAVKGLHDAPLPLFAAADARDDKLSAEAVEPHVALVPMSEVQESSRITERSGSRLEELSNLLASVGSREDLAWVYRIKRGDAKRTAAGRTTAMRPSDRSGRRCETSSSCAADRRHQGYDLGFLTSTHLSIQRRHLAEASDCSI